MANILYNRFNFVTPVSENDKFITIADINGVKRYNITPSNVTASYALGVFIYVKTIGTDKIIELMFTNANEAFLSLQKLQQALGKFNTTTNSQSGLSDADKIYITNQINLYINKSKYNEHFEDLSIWEVNHNLYSNQGLYHTFIGHKPSVSIIDDDGNICEAHINYLDGDNLSIDFGQPVSGWIYLN